jgi:hypothetical protein
MGQIRVGKVILMAMSLGTLDHGNRSPIHQKFGFLAGATEGERQGQTEPQRGCLVNVFHCQTTDWPESQNIASSFMGRP